VAEPTADEQFAAAFRRWGLDVDGTAPSEAAALLKTRPAVVVTEVVAALDEWASEMRQQAKPKAEWQRLDDLAAALDDDPGSLRREMREIMSRGQLPVERTLGVLSAVLRPVPVPAALPWGRDRLRLRELAERIDPVSEPVLGLLTLTRALLVAGEEALAERLLRDAVQAHRSEVVLYHTLGQLLTSQGTPRWAEAVGYYRAAGALRPDLGVNLATALLQSGREREGLDLLARLVQEKPDNPHLLFSRAYALYAKGDVDGAVTCYKKGLELDPKHVNAHTNLGLALKDKGDMDGAVACCKKALDLEPKNAIAHNLLGVVLAAKGDLDGAVACYKKALDFEPEFAQALATSATPCAPKGTWTVPSPTARRLSNSTPGWPRPTTTSASPCRTRATWTVPSPATRRPSNSTPRTAPPTTTSATPCSPGATWRAPLPASRRLLNLTPRTPSPTTTSAASTTPRAT
jgi:tetratricopeptide (TPR) repeat protein